MNKDKDKNVEDIQYDKLMSECQRECDEKQKKLSRQAKSNEKFYSNKKIRKNQPHQKKHKRNQTNGNPLCDCYLNKIPKDVLEHIASFLVLKDIRSLAFASKKMFYRLIHLIYLKYKKGPTLNTNVLFGNMGIKLLHIYLMVCDIDID